MIRAGRSCLLAAAGRVGLLAAVGLLGTSCAARDAFYEPVGFWEARTDAYGDDLLPVLVDEHLASGRIETLSLVGAGPAPTLVRRDQLDQLPAAILFAAHATATRRARGGEFDLLVRDEDHVVPVTVWASPDGDLRVETGRAPPAPTPPPAHADPARWKAELAARYGLVRIEDAGGRWTLTELGDLSTALDRLTPLERAALRGLVLGRGAESPRVPSRELAFYDPRAVPPRIDFYDLAFEAFDSGFVGPLDAPVRAPVMTLLHEFGHALADRPMREVWEQYLALDAELRRERDPDRVAALGRDQRAALRELRRLGVRGPVIEDYARVRGGARGPTSWAWRQVHESFAEAFALHHADPDALRRVMPSVFAWFEAGGHLGALDARDGAARSRTARPREAEPTTGSPASPAAK